MKAVACIEETMDEFCRFCLFIHFPDKGVMLCVTWPRLTLTVTLCEIDEADDKLFPVIIADEIPDLCWRLFATESVSAEDNLLAIHGESLKALAEKYAIDIIKQTQPKEDDIVLD